VNDSDLQPEPTPSSQPTPSTPRWITVVGIIAVLLLAAFAAMSRIRVDSKVISSPGSVLEIESVVEVTDGPFFPSEGEIYLTTVSTNLDPTVIEYIAAWFDDSAVILDRELVLGDRSIEQNRTLGQEQMTQSQDIATRVALECAHPAGLLRRTRSGGGVIRRRCDRSFGQRGAYLGRPR
jgi:PDZ domain-containing secreted protein